MARLSARMATASLLVAVSLGACGDRGADPRLVQACFDAYKSAAIRSDGAAAEECVSPMIVELFSSFREMALDADRATLDEMPVFRKLQVLLLRHEVDRDRLDAMNGADAFRLAFERGWIGDASWVAGADLGDIVIEGEVALAEIFEDGVPTEEHVQFRQVAGVWRIDLGATLEAADRWEKARLNETGLSENRYMFKRVEHLTGRPVDDHIWAGPGAR